LASAGIQLAGCPRGSAAELEFLRQQEDQLPYKLAYQAGSADGPATLVIWGWEPMTSPYDWNKHPLLNYIRVPMVPGF